MDSKNKDFIVYTCITGAYEKKNYGHVLDNSIKYICFSDDESFVPKGWEFRPIKGLESFNYKDTNRYIKMHPHKYFSNYKMSIYIDYNILIKRNLKNLFLKTQKSQGIVFMYDHPYRKCSYEEIKKVVSNGLAPFNKGMKQYSKYKNIYFPGNLGLFEANIIIRKHNQKKSLKLMEYWWNEYKDSSKRDQTSLLYSSLQTGVKITSLGKCGLRAGKGYFYLNSNQFRSYKVKSKNLIRHYFNSFLLIFRGF